MDRILEFLVTLLLSPIMLWNKIQRQYWLRTKGFWADIEYRYGIKYEEMQNGRIEHLIIPGNIQFGEPGEIYVPSSKEWQATMPEWAKQRKEEIVERAKILCSPEKYEYREEKDQDG
jgi:hypothetical protein